MRKNEIVVDRENNRAFIKLENMNGLKADVIIDLEDLERVSKYYWRLNSKGIITCDICYTPVRKTISLVRFIIDAPEGEQVYFRSKNRFNFRKYNLYIKKPRYLGKIGKNSKLCSHEDCNGKVIARGLCPKHYSREIRKENKLK